MKIARNEKRKKLLGFSFYIDIGDFEAFLWNLNLSENNSFWRCAYPSSSSLNISLADSNVPLGALTDMLKKKKIQK